MGNICGSSSTAIAKKEIIRKKSKTEETKFIDEEKEKEAIKQRSEKQCNCELIVDGSEKLEPCTCTETLLEDEHCICKETDNGKGITESEAVTAYLMATTITVINEIPLEATEISPSEVETVKPPGIEEIPTAVEQQTEKESKEESSTIETMKTKEEEAINFQETAEDKEEMKIQQANEEYQDTDQQKISENQTTLLSNQ